MKTHNAFYLAAAIWWVAETWYFGWNMRPKSTAETVADGFVPGLVLVALRFDLIDGIHEPKEQP